ncbi:MAG: type II toxin-antitoxin system RelE/ParE family toxin [Caldilineales bacterium]|nr:type II toxin-antitoxin system RelE/ParE family toxin [Caldilineales bacterium]MCW5858140.1 type II toxin-antitoxin system RelE/ParE family toxin [Caldilineales bacterium]
MNEPSSRRYTVIVERQVEKALWRLPKDILTRVDRLLLSLVDEPRPAACKKLRGYENLYRLRVGDWRMIYAIEDDRLVVLVIEIAPRGGVYRDL